MPGHCQVDASLAAMSSRLTTSMGPVGASAAAAGGGAPAAEESLGRAPGHRLEAAWACLRASSIWGMMRWCGGGIFGGVGAFFSCGRTAGWPDAGGGAWGRGTGTPNFRAARPA